MSTKRLRRCRETQNNGGDKHNSSSSCLTAWSPFQPGRLWKDVFYFEVCAQGSRRLIIHPWPFVHVCLQLKRRLLVSATTAVGSPYRVSARAGLAVCTRRREPTLGPSDGLCRPAVEPLDWGWRGGRGGLFIHLFIFNNICLIFQSCEVFTHVSEWCQELMCEDYYESNIQKNKLHLQSYCKQMVE